MDAVVLALASAALFGSMTVALRFALARVPDAEAGALLTIIVAFLVTLPFVAAGELELDGRLRGYEEIWERVDEGHVGVVLTAAHAVVVRVGNQCIALRDRRRTYGRFDVRQSRAVVDGWVDVIVLGDGAELAPPPVRLPTFWDVGSEIVIEGAHWRVAERWG